MNIGVVGIGTMGQPIASRLLRAGHHLIVWNRTIARCQPLIERGAELAASIDDLCQRADVVLLVLLHEQAIDEVLGRDDPAFCRRVENRTFVLVSTTSAEYSLALESDIRAGGGHYAEAPVSGSRVPAEQGRLIGMIAGETDVVECVVPLLQPVCRQVFQCGQVPAALRMKLAVNHYLIGMVTALAECVHAAQAVGVDLNLMRQILDAGPMASEVSRGKLARLVEQNYAPQAALRDVATIAELVEHQAGTANLHVPLIAACASLYRRAVDHGFGDQDMIALNVAGVFRRQPA